MLNLDRMLLLKIISVYIDFEHGFKEAEPLWWNASLVHEGRALNLKKGLSKKQTKTSSTKQPALPGTRPSAEPSTTEFYSVYIMAQ